MRLPVATTGLEFDYLNVEIVGSEMHVKGDIKFDNDGRVVVSKICVVALFESTELAESAILAMESTGRLVIYQPG